MPKKNKNSIHFHIWKANQRLWNCFGSDQATWQYLIIMQCYRNLIHDLSFFVIIFKTWSSSVAALFVWSDGSWSNCSGKNSSNTIWSSICSYRVKILTWSDQLELEKLSRSDLILQNPNFYHSWVDASWFSKRRLFIIWICSLLIGGNLILTTLKSL